MRTRFTNVQWFFLILFFAVGAILAIVVHQGTASTIIAAAFVLLGLLAASALQIANQWEKAVVLRLGKFHKLAGPGIFFIIPIVDRVSNLVDQRVVTTGFSAEQTLTQDTVPIDVDAVLFWVVWDAKKAALEVAGYEEAVNWAAQTALRDMIGRTPLGDLLAGREEIDAQLQAQIDARTEPWGIAVQSVKIRDIAIPDSLQDAMSREAQAERERRARVILGTAEQEIANTFVQAAETYGKHPMALQLRAMNILYEGLKEKASMVVVPSQMVESVNLGTLLGASHFQQQMTPTSNTPDNDA